jgi:quercetin dioxygenase-like cupin family protein
VTRIDHDGAPWETQRVNDAPPPPLSGNVADASKHTRGWFLGHFMPGADNPLRNDDVELKWFTHAAGETRAEWSPPSSVRTLNILIRGKFILLFPDHEVPLENEGDFVLFGPGVAHSYRSEAESLVMTVRWPSIA